MPIIRRHIILIVAVVLSWTSLSCNALQEIQRAMVNVTRCQFRIGGVSDFTLGGISLNGKSSFNIGDGARLLSEFTQNRLPATFTVNLLAKNPNDGTGGTPKASATMTSFAWKLIIDSTTTINGDIASPITIPGTGQETTIPLRMNLDLLQFFRDKGYDHILNLGLALGGVNKSASRITLRAKPSIKTDYGTIAYPGEIDVIDKEFRAE